MILYLCLYDLHPFKIKTKPVDKLNLLLSLVALKLLSSSSLRIESLCQMFSILKTNNIAIINK